MGKHKYIETPERMWELFCEYRDEIKDNPIQLVEQRKGNTIIPKGFEGKMPDPVVSLPAQRPLTMEGFQNFLDDSDVITDVTDYFENKDNRYEDYIRICKRIKRTIRQDQIEGGMVGIYNPSITQRLNGLVEKTDNKTDGKIEVQVNYANRSNTTTTTHSADSGTE
jgi:hypothetical protein